MAGQDTNVLVNLEWVERQLNNPNVVIAEVDSNPNETYDIGHIPGAVSWNLHTDFEDPIRRDIPSPESISLLLSRSGVQQNTTVVLYGDGNNRSATWAFWVLKYYGLQKVHLMDGGRKKWLNDKRPVSIDKSSTQTTKYGVSSTNINLRSLKADILRRLGNQSTKLLDTRTIEEYSGELAASPGGHQPDIYRKGRIPGALHIPWDDAATEEGSFKPIDELRDLYRPLGLQPGDEIITYCRLGIRASYTWFVLKYLLCHNNVRNYDGSWTEWGNACLLYTSPSPRD